MAVTLKVRTADALKKGAQWLMRGAGNNGGIGKVKVLAVSNAMVDGQMRLMLRIQLPPKTEIVTDPKYIIALLSKVEGLAFSKPREYGEFDQASANLVGLTPNDLSAISDDDVKAALGSIGR